VSNPIGTCCNYLKSMHLTYVMKYMWQGAVLMWSTSEAIACWQRTLRCDRVLCKHLGPQQHAEGRCLTL
jgi:hypothetical protein